MVPSVSVKSEYRFVDYGSKGVPILNNALIVITNLHPFVRREVRRGPARPGRTVIQKKTSALPGFSLRWGIMALTQAGTLTEYSARDKRSAVAQAACNGGRR